MEEVKEEAMEEEVIKDMEEEVMDEEFIQEVMEEDVIQEVEEFLHTNAMVFLARFTLAVEQHR